MSRIQKNMNLGEMICVAFCMSIALLSAFGCSEVEPTEQQPLESHDAPPLELPVVNESIGEIRDRMRGLDWTSSEYKDLKLKMMVASDQEFEPEVIKGYRPLQVQQSDSKSAYVDKETGEIAWRAWACFNPECSGSNQDGGPLVFAQPWDNAHIDEHDNSKVTFDLVQLSEEDQSRPPIVCPKCGRVEFLSPYRSPQVELRRRQLLQELKDVRAARDRMRADKKKYPKNLRTPAEIRKEIEELPKLFLVPDKQKK